MLNKKNRAKALASALNFYLLSFIFYLLSLHYPRKSHERQGQNASGDQGDRSAFHALRGFHQVDVLTDTGEDDQSQSETDGNTDSIDDGFTQAEHVGNATIVEFLCNHGQRNAEHGAVGGDQR